MIDILDQPLYFVGKGLSKEEAYTAVNKGQLVRLVQGIYINPDYDVREAFNEFGFRIAKELYPDAALSHSTAWFKRPMSDRIFLGGDYSYKKKFGGVGRDGKLQDCLIVQSPVHPDFTRQGLYESIKVTDQLGSFTMQCPTLALQILQQMDATKVHPEKHLPEPVIIAMWEQLQEQHGGRHRAFDVIEEVAQVTDKKRESDRFFKRFYRHEAS